MYAVECYSPDYNKIQNKTNKQSNFDIFYLPELFTWLSNKYVNILKNMYKISFDDIPIRFYIQNMYRNEIMYVGMWKYELKLAYIII